MKAKFFILLVSILSLGSYLCFTHSFKLGLTSDSVQYMFVAESLLNGDGFVDEDGIFVSHWPPLYSIMLALFSKITSTTVQMAGWYLNAFLIFSLPLITYKIVKILELKFFYKITLPIIIVTSAAVLRHTYLLSEGLFLSLLLIILLLFLKYIKHDNIKYLIGSGIVSGLLILTRYAGIGFITGCCIYLLFIQPKTIRFKLRTLIIYSLCTASLFLLWLLYSYGMDAPRNIREFYFHPVSLHQLFRILKTIAHWFVSLTFVNAIFLVLIIAGLLKTQITLIPRLIKNNIVTYKPYVRLLTTLIVSYVLFIIVALSFFDSEIPIGNRIFSCIFPLIILLIALILNFKIEYKQLNWVVSLSFIFLFYHSIDNNKSIWKNHYNNGSGYTSLAWKNSEVLQHAFQNNLLDVYSNAHGVMRLHKNITTTLVPVAKSEQFTQDISFMAKEVALGKRDILLFNKMNRGYFVSKEFLLDYFKDYNISYFKDGIIISKPLATNNL